MSANPGLPLSLRADPPRPQRATMPFALALGLWAIVGLAMWAAIVFSVWQAVVRLGQ